MFKLNKKSGAVLAAGALALAVVGSTSAHAQSLKTGWGSINKNRSVYFLTSYNPAGDVFWAQMLNGAKDAAQLANLKLTHQTADGKEDTMVQNIAAATATKPSVIMISFNFGEKLTAATCAAKAKGIKVIAFNVPAPTGAKKCVSAFIGQDFYSTGKLVGERLLASTKLGKGDLVFFPVEAPEQVYAIQRGGGVQAALDTVGAKGEFLASGMDDAGALDKMTAWLTAHKTTVKAVTPLGGTPHRNLIKAMEAAGVSVPVVGFDTSPQVVAGIKSGKIIATADQQGYNQGFLTVIQAGLYADFGLTPADINSGGAGLIDKTNVKFLESKKLQGVRY